MLRIQTWINQLCTASVETSWKFTSYDRVWSMLFFAGVISKSSKKPGQALSQTLEFELSGKTPKRPLKKKRLSYSKKKTAKNHLNQSSLLHMCPSEVHTKRPGRWMCCANCESRHNFHLEINKRRLSGVFFFFLFSYLLCSANTSTHDEGFNQQWSSPTVSLDSKTEPVSSDVFHCGI